VQLNEKTAEFYDEDAAQYDELRFASQAGRRNHATQIQLIESLLPADTGKTVEVGSGTGRFTRVVAPRTSDYVIIDVAAQMLAAANRAVPVTRPLIGDATNLPLQSESVDTLVCLNVLNHVPAFDRALAEFGRVLKPGGILLVNFNNVQSPYFLPGMIVNRRKRAFRADVFSHWQTWSAFRNALNHAQLTITASRGHLPMPSRTPDPLVPMGSGLDSLLRGRARFSPAPIIRAQRQ
jgi:ubiquinone/menaquinone biosynthesis C-methylase UbiE